MDIKKQDQEPEPNDEEILDNRKHLILNDVPVDEQSMAFSKDNIEYLRSDMTWKDLGLDDQFIDVLMQKGFKKPSKVQTSCIRASRKNSVSIQAQNGAGKTLAFLIPCIMQIDSNIKGSNEYGVAAPQVIILGDTKALLLQIHKILHNIADNYKVISSDYLFGGKKDLNPNCQLLLTTMIQLKNSLSKKLIDLKNVKLIAVDEADSVFDSDVGKNFFMSFIVKLQTTNTFKIIFTSATVTENSKQVISKVQAKHNIVVLELPKEQLTLKNVFQYLVKYKTLSQKMDMLDLLMKKVNAQNILIFANTKAMLEKLKDHLLALDYKVGYIYKSGDEMNSGPDTADYIQKQINDFLAGKYRILLTTNLLSRGIDMRKVTLVINFDLPIKIHKDEDKTAREVDVETYLHRVGRTGRFGDQGIALNFVHEIYEQNMIDTIQNFYKNDIKEINADDLDNLNKTLEEISQVNIEKREYLEENI